MAKTPYTRFFWSDWIADTSHLDLTLKGAYMLLLEYYYQHRKPIPGDMDKVYRICHVHSQTDQFAVKSVLSEFFYPFEDPEYGMVYRHNRADREIEWSDAQYRESIINGAIGAWTRWGSNEARATLEKYGVDVPQRAENSPPNSPPTSPPSRDPNGDPNGNPNSNQNQNQNQRKKSILPPVSSKTTSSQRHPPNGGKSDQENDDFGFQRFWSLYPRRVNKAKAEQSYNRIPLRDREQIIQTLAKRPFDGVDQKYIPHPTTYLNGRRWEDETEQDPVAAWLSGEGIFNSNVIEGELA